MKLGGILQGAVACSLFALAGCGGDKLNGVSGMVTYKGKPVEKGTISFRPAAAGGAASGSATITNGKYEIPAKQGLPVGSYKVSITTVGADPVARDIIPGSEPIKEEKEVLPAKYNAQTTLTYTVEPGSNSKDFPLD